MPQTFKLDGLALPADAAHMLDEIAEHFVEHAEVSRRDDFLLMTSDHGRVTIEKQDERLAIRLACPSEEALQVVRNSIAEHMFFFAGEDPLELTWAETGARGRAVPNLRQATVVGAEDVTPHMRRVKLATADVTPFIGGAMHVRILVPPRGRTPIWPHYGADGRLVWPDGEDKLVVRPYTIRAVDKARGELWIDFLQHPTPGIGTPGADFARDAETGDVIGLIGPGSGGLPEAKSILMIGDESSLPAIARIAAEVPDGTSIRAIIEVWDKAEEQPLPSAGEIDVTWLHRSSYPADAIGTLREEATKAIALADAETFMWVACEKEDVRAIKALLNSRKHDRHLRYVAWYWEK
ncbi:side tail fiber protein [Agaricicola taiwanensis]|uniref:Side tail fiber protein n=2 Tax=Agaricicola taiwanensis TaxID=591372 RepID=A0A8J2YKZ8_9RHOB|nr:side tail fiber protein [Agaricicola taiwanensis]